MRTSSRVHAGFTLIEMLMAAAAGALILAVLVNVYGRAIKLRNTSAEHTRESRLEARAVTVLRNDLRNARLSGGVMAATLESGAGSAGTSSRFPGNLRLDTTTGTINEDNFAPELQEVEYYIGEDPSSTDGKSGALKRTINRNILATSPEIDREETILTGVEAMEVSFFDGTNWQEGWQVDPDNLTLPTAIRVRLTLATDAHPGSSRKTIEVLVPWTMQIAIPAATSATAATGDSQ